MIGYFAVNAAVRSWDCAFNYADEFPLIFIDGLLQVLFGLMASCSHDSLVVIQRDNIKDQSGDVRV